MTVFWGLMIPLAGTTLGSACVFFSERQTQRAAAERAVGLCIRRHGSGVCLVAFDSVDGYGGGNGTVCICTGGDWHAFWAWRFCW